ncbi:TetR family transcriptional regulator [Nostoc sp. MBR 210]|uniref:TetR/AcrR family transcriptional regulator n=1 Tax=Nostoc spongiaeforme FACHB-130 TaxID=1357510 RepID=A0ABR8FY29_9NOSO|nr:TetR/AcrR family transcriptional regulator [Nostoc spongiaeforme FACHB-130]OCQ90754.1 TetR family transcriptional regulator [Nostoc sp. MBR 210]
MKYKKRQIEQDNPDRSAEKVDAILAGAIQEFLENGYAATTMDKVTSAAGVSKTTVYSYFQDKETLFAALVERLVGEKCLPLLNPQDPEFHQGDPKIVLRFVAKGILDEVTCEPEFLGLIRLIIGESGRFPSLAQVFLKNIDKSGLDLISQYFAAHPELQLPDPQAAARIFIGTLVHFMITQHMLHGKEIMPMESDRLIDNLVNLITINLTPKTELADKYTGTRQKTPRRKRTSSGKFQTDYRSEPKQLRSIRLTDTAWEKLAELAAENNLTRSEMIEIFARQSNLERESGVGSGE